MLSRFEISERCAPRVCLAGTDLGPITAEAATASGCRGRAGSSSAASTSMPGRSAWATSSRGWSRKLAGTALAAVRCADQLARDLGPGVFQGPAFREGLFWQMTVSDVSAACLQWYRDQLADRPDFDELTAAAAGIQPGSMD